MVLTESEFDLLTHQLDVPSLAALEDADMLAGLHHTQAVAMDKRLMNNGIAADWDLQYLNLLRSTFFFTHEQAARMAHAVHWRDERIIFAASLVSRLIDERLLSNYASYFSPKEWQQMGFELGGLLSCAETTPSSRYILRLNIATDYHVARQLAATYLEEAKMGYCGGVHKTAWRNVFLNGRHVEALSPECTADKLSEWRVPRSGTLLLDYISFAPVPKSLQPASNETLELVIRALGEDRGRLGYADFYTLVQDSSAASASSVVAEELPMDPVRCGTLRPTLERFVPMPLTKKILKSVKKGLKLKKPEVPSVTEVLRLIKVPAGSMLVHISEINDAVILQCVSGKLQVLSLTSAGMIRLDVTGHVVKGEWLNTLLPADCQLEEERSKCGLRVLEEAELIVASASALRKLLEQAPPKGRPPLSERIKDLLEAKDAKTLDQAPFREELTGTHNNVYELGPETRKMHQRKMQLVRLALRGKSVSSAQVLRLLASSVLKSAEQRVDAIVACWPLCRDRSRHFSHVLNAIRPLEQLDLFQRLGWHTAFDLLRGGVRTPMRLRLNVPDEAKFAEFLIKLSSPPLVARGMEARLQQLSVDGTDIRADTSAGAQAVWTRIERAVASAQKMNGGGAGEQVLELELSRSLDVSLSLTLMLQRAARVWLSRRRIRSLKDPLKP
mmetsp:Transcript_5577/g.19166  ORF Transcript_5577/g.19166 Transcript_5577/m.19166 type:complete len:672 (-) Transcript_5577:37-2052(-)